MLRKSTKLTMITILLLILVSGSSFTLVYLTNLIKNDAKVINYAGIVRGSIQRLAKLEAGDVRSDELIIEIDKLISDFHQNKIPLKGNNEKFMDTILQTKDQWVALKKTIYNYREAPLEINKMKIISQSEMLWDQANYSVFTAQLLSERKIYYFKLLAIFLLFNLFLIILIIFLIRFYVRDNLEYMVNHDALTGIYNRGFFREFLIKEIDKAKRYDWDLALIMLDIDHFKNVNDRYGHDVGDHVLKELANIINKNIRSSDVFARVGGEEFAIIALNTNKEDAYKLSEKLREMVEKYNFKSVKKLTISIGITKFTQDDNIDSFYKRADLALYKAKENGRNRVEVG